MKRFMLFIAMVGFMATSCSKTIVNDEVETAISFSTESSKLTRAIVQGNTYFDTQPFGVFAYGSNDGTEPFMNNVEVSCTSNTWKATGTTKYYWPNDPETTVNFYAYSPAGSTANMTQGLAPHQQLNGTVAHTEADGFSLTGYVHSNMYVDFMVATPVKGATFGNPDGNAQADDTDGKVPMVFHHQMTQIIFTVKTNAAYSGVNFAVESITLKNIKDKANFTHTYTKEENSQTVASNYGVWGDHAKTSGEGNPNGVYRIFPANESNFGESDVDEYDYNFSNNTVKDENNAANFTGATGKIVTNTTTWTTTPVTMIPQSMDQTTTPPQAGIDTYASEVDAQVFEIVYTVAGTGVAKEKVVKHVPFYAYNAATAAIPWGVNQKITYNVVIGLNEITFEPSVAVWDDGKTQDDQDGYNQDFTFQQ